MPFVALLSLSNRVSNNLLRRTGGPLVAASLLLSAASARADATVVVEVKQADGGIAEGTVHLTKGDTKLTCTTHRGRCELKNVPGGTYSAVLEQPGKPAGKPKTVMIPPTGEVKLIMAAR